MDKITREDVMTDLEIVRATAQIIKTLASSAEAGSGDSTAMAMDMITGHAAEQIMKSVDNVMEKLQPAAKG